MSIAEPKSIQSPGHSSFTQPSQESNRVRAVRLLKTEIQFVNSPVFQEWRDQPPLKTDLDGWRRLDSTTWLDPGEELLWFRWMNYKKYRANQWRGRLSPETACHEAMDRLECLLEDACQIRNRLVTVYVKLGASVATSFTNAYFSMDELISEANCILIRCTEMFDADRGFRFSTYATHSIRRHLVRFVKGKAKRAICAPQEILESEPDDAKRWSFERERQFTLCFHKVEQLIDELGAREQFIVRERYGLGEKLKPQTLQSIAGELGVSRERVRQIEQRALGKLIRKARELNLDD